MIDVMKGSHDLWRKTHFGCHQVHNDELEAKWKTCVFRKKIHLLQNFYFFLFSSFLGVCDVCWRPHSCQSNGHLKRPKIVEFVQKVSRFCSNLPKKFEILGRCCWSEISDPLSDTFFRTRKYRNGSSGKNYLFLY